MNHEIPNLLYFITKIKQILQNICYRHHQTSVKNTKNPSSLRILKLIAQKNSLQKNG